jgi:hypothetical protein
MLSSRQERVLITESQLVSMGLRTLHFSCRVTGIFNIGLHTIDDDACPYAQVTACKSLLPA